MFIITCLLIAFCCTAMNHLGLVGAAERLLSHPIPVVNCSKCSTFWLTLMHGVCYHCGFSHRCLVMAVAVAFLMSYIAIWMELAMGCIDKVYYRIYDALYPAAANAADAADGAAAAGTDTTTDNNGSPDNEMPGV